jgi:hypothetical protein
MFGESFSARIGRTQQAHSPNRAGHFARSFSVKRAERVTACGVRGNHGKLVHMRMYFAVLLVLDLCGRASLPSIPDNLKPPANETLIVQAHATGDQIYVCNASSWAFSRPDAKLFDGSGRRIGSHFAGPTWEYSDGSRVIGKPSATATRDSNSIPWLRWLPPAVAMLNIKGKRPVRPTRRSIFSNPGAH